MVPEFSMFYKKISRHFLKVPVKLRGNFDHGSHRRETLINERIGSSNGINFWFSGSLSKCTQDCRKWELGHSIKPTDLKTTYRKLDSNSILSSLHVVISIVFRQLTLPTNVLNVSLAGYAARSSTHACNLQRH